MLGRAYKGQVGCRDWLLGLGHILYSTTREWTSARQGVRALLAQGKLVHVSMGLLEPELAQEWVQQCLGCVSVPCPVLTYGAAVPSGAMPSALPLVLWHQHHVHAVLRWPKVRRLLVLALVLCPSASAGLTGIAPGLWHYRIGLSVGNCPAILSTVEALHQGPPFFSCQGRITPSCSYGGLEYISYIENDTPLSS